MLDTFGTTFERAGLDLETQVVRPAPARLASEVFTRLLDEVDYGMLLVDMQGRIQHANHVARHELASGRVLCGRGAKLTACVESQSVPMGQAIRRACEGQRVLLEMGLADARLAVAFTPLAHAMDGLQDEALVVCGRRQVCQAPAIHCFAQLHGLTRAEREVLQEACAGRKPEAIAATLGVGLATVRSQIQSIRRKTGAKSMPQVIMLMATLPPLVPSLRLH